MEITLFCMHLSIESSFLTVHALIKVNIQLFLFPLCCPVVTSTEAVGATRASLKTKRRAASLSTVDPARGETATSFRGAHRRGALVETRDHTRNGRVIPGSHGEWTCDPGIKRGMDV